MHVGIAHHLGWAIAVTASADHALIDRRRIALVEDGRPTMPVHARESAGLDDDELAALVDEVRASARRATTAALDELGRATAPAPIASLSLRDWPDDLPTDLATLRRPPYEARADSVMYREVLEAAARERGWAVHRFDPRDVEHEAGAILRGAWPAPGPPWTKDHRLAFAAAVVAGA